jgi:exodeoxyribonuclease V beta subunit
MTGRENFDLVQTEIGQGPMLIEASAGTGKTFAIAGLVLRLLIERPELTIDRILVTTFTELATAELRGRIHDLLWAARHAFQTGQSNDDMLRKLLEKYRDRAGPSQRLDDALKNFDEAPIYTIHGFCQRVLAERAFESGALFDRELVTNQTDLLREVAYDFWRSHFYGGEIYSALLALKNGITPESLVTDLDELTRNPTLQFLPNEWRPLPEIVRDLNDTLIQLRQSWAKEEKKLRALFADGAWALHNHGKPEKMLPLLDTLARCLGERGGTADQLECIASFARRTIEVRVRKGFSAPPFSVFDGCDRLLDLEQDFQVAVRAEFFTWARTQVAERKLARNVFSYDDLLTQLDAALAAPAGKELAKTIREKYQAALIDEFQDTDPVQYSIFSRIYHGSDALVALIGDPKQAIYAFRGADVFTYMQAAAETPATRQFTLATNWRSETPLVRAVNTIFDRPNPFLLPDIGFERATSSGQADERPLRAGKKMEPPFQLWRADKDADLPAQIASEMVRLLSRDLTIGEQPLEPSHLAVLTSTNAQAAQMQDALRARRIPSVLYSTANVFFSHEAHELRDVLAAVVQPGYEKFLRAALCTDALGRTGNDLDTFTRDETAWESELLRFQKYHQLWRTDGFIQMLRHLSVEHALRRRLLSYPDGERRLTNFLHLAELLHQACVEHRLGMSGLLKWLGQRMQEKSFAERVEHELRLESDENAVRIITVHKSKGLEFDIVFCPYTGWSRRELPKTFHDSNNRLTRDLADPKSHEQERETEARAELLRQFYVALTRARHRCVMAWRPPAKGEDKSAPAYLLGSPSAVPNEIETSADITIADLPPASNESWEPPHKEAESPLQPRKFPRTIDRSWGIASFTRLISGRETDPLDEGRVDELPVVEESESAIGIHAFPKGMRAGTCLHEILQHLDFANLTNAPEIAERRLRGYGIDEFDEPVIENVRELASLPLTDGRVRFTLADVPNDSRIAELEFSFPISGLTIAKLAGAFARDELPLRIERLQFQKINGFMNGFIDLVFEHEGRFYFADWKSNWLGPTRRAYHAAAIAGEMQRNFYLLQLSLYSVALHRYLRVRQPGYDFEQHFGGAFYIFLRGIDSARPDNGVFFQRPTRDFIENLSRILES